ncbi:MAG: flagellar hook-basal body complex protein [Oscillospiraceae bacterium]|jgi:flagellar basal-body rod protein FlgG|nr:flagellar hook-basal body complex protein [Oscillospiraceae bacterium]
MVRGQYIAGTGMMHQRRQMENVISNITNADTTGYKKTYLVSQTFDDVMINRINDKNNTVAADPNWRARAAATGPLNFGVRADQVYINYTTGSFEETGENTDMAIAGEGAFFVVGTPAGERYTKAGSFVVNQLGYLTDGDGNFLMGENGGIYVGDNDFAVDAEGNVLRGSQIIDRIRIVEFDDLGTLRRQGHNLYYTDGGQARAAQNYSVMQGFVENSNVEIAREMVDMITVFRAYETNQKMLTMIDETVGKAVNEIGRVR